MRLSLPLSVVLTTAFGTMLHAQATGAKTDQNITGTWVTKAEKVITGPGFYDPVNDKFFEPALTGVSYSFTDDGHYETALYRAISNPANPNCPGAILQWQHGTFTKNPNGSLSLQPFAVDGRQVLSLPCEHKDSIFTRYDQPEYIDRHESYTDPFNKRRRLDLFQYDGAPQNPMWLAYYPPQMLPTVTLNPTATATGAAKSTGTGKSKRGLEGGDTSEAQIQWNIPKSTILESPLEDTIWWMIALGTVVSSILYLRA